MPIPARHVNCMTDLDKAALNFDYKNKIISKK
jgi:hypothetical protein